MTPEQEYKSKVVATTMNLQRYYNECLEMINRYDSEGKPQEDAFLELQEVDIKWAKLIVDDISPKKELLEM